MKRVVLIPAGLAAMLIAVGLLMHWSRLEWAFAVGLFAIASAEERWNVRLERLEQRIGELEERIGRIDGQPR